jgi:hypothetical protein
VGVGAEDRGAGEEIAVARERGAEEDAEQEGAADVDGEGPKREVAAEAGGDRGVEGEPPERADAAEHSNSDPDERAHPRNLNLRTLALANWTPA